MVIRDHIGATPIADTVTVQLEFSGRRSWHRVIRRQ